MIPKFRVFAKAGTKELFGGGYDTDQMFYEIRDIDFYDKEVTVWGCHNKNCGTCDDTYKMEDVEILMSTGLKDINDVEIFEGDYLSLISFESQKEFKGEVVFSKGSFCMVVRLKGHDYKVPLHELSNSNFLIEVLGNIHENVELLEVAE